MWSSQGAVLADAIAISEGLAVPDVISRLAQRSASTTSCRGSAQDIATGGLKGRAGPPTVNEPVNQPVSAFSGARHSKGTACWSAIIKGCQTGGMKERPIYSHWPDQSRPVLYSLYCCIAEIPGDQHRLGQITSTRPSISANSPIRNFPGPLVSRSSTSAFHTLRRLPATARVMPGSVRTDSSSTKSPSSSAR